MNDIRDVDWNSIASQLDVAELLKPKSPIEILGEAMGITLPIEKTDDCPKAYDDTCGDADAAKCKAEKNQLLRKANENGYN